MNEKEFLIRICVCFALSVTIGLERQWRRRQIGLRTNVLVCIGAFLFVSMGIKLSGNDISRIPAQVVSGIGFLGAGVILKDGKNIRGLNTAATLWCNAAIGVLTASGMLFEATVGTLYILFTNIVLRFVTYKIMKKETSTKERYLIKIICTEEKEMAVRTLLSQIITKEEMILIKLESRDLEDHNVKLYATLEVGKDEAYIAKKLVNKISIEVGVSSIGIIKDEIKTDEKIDIEEE